MMNLLFNKYKTSAAQKREKLYYTTQSLTDANEPIAKQWDTR